MNSSEALAHYRDKLDFETDAWDLNEMLREGKGVVVIDARSEAAFAQEHIPRAVNIPHRKMDADTTRQLDRTALYVTYCDGIGCNASPEVGGAGLSRERVDRRNRLVEA